MRTRTDYVRAPAHIVRRVPCPKCAMPSQKPCIRRDGTEMHDRVHSARRVMHAMVRP